MSFPTPPTRQSDAKLVLGQLTSQKKAVSNQERRLEVTDVLDKSEYPQITRFVGSIMS